MRHWWALALCLLLAAPAFAQAKTLSELERDLISLDEFRSIITEKMDGQRKTIREITERIAGWRSSRMVEALYKSQIEMLELQKSSLEKSLVTHAALVENYNKQIAGTQEKIAALQEEEHRKDEQAALAAREAAEREARLEADRAAEAKRIEREQRLAAEREAAERVAEERRIAREEARERRQWTLIAVVGGMLVGLLGLFAALRAFGVSASIAEWSRSFYWLTRAAIVLTFALFFLTAVETIFGSLTIPDWMRRPLADLLDKASDAVAPRAEEASK